MFNEFFISIALHQRSVLSHYLFHISNVRSQPRCVNDIVLVDESSSGTSSRLELWKQTLRTKGFKLSGLRPNV